MQVESNANMVAADLASLGATASRKIRTVVRTHTQLLLAAVKREASTPRSVPRPGPGGPRLLTGNYNRSLNMVVGGSAFYAEGRVGTNAVQGRRLEFGFSGTDSAGRGFNQKPYPHFKPAVEQIEGPFGAAITAVLVAVR